MCVYSLSYPACIESYCRQCPVCLCHIAPDYLINGRIFGKKNIEPNPCVLFFLIRLSEKSVILGINGSDLMFIGPCIILIVELRETNLMSFALLFHYLMLNMFRMLVHPSSGACDLFVELFHGLYCSGSMCVGVTVWFGWGGVVSLCRLKHYCFSNTSHEINPQ